MALGIIVPIYNTGEYLRKCLTSIQNQTFKNWNCYLVDDCSTDPLTINIIQTFLNDSRFHLIRNKSNCGVSFSRNKGIELSILENEYITFIDHDDWIEPNLYSKAISLFKKGIDWVGFGQRRWNDKNESWVKELERKTPSGEYELLNSPRYTFVWNKIFKSDIIKKYDIKFLEERDGISAIPEDTCFSILYAAYASRGYYLKDLLYNHIYHSSSLAVQVNNDKNVYYRKLLAFLLLRSELVRRNVYSNVSNVVEKRISKLIRQIGY